MTTACFDIYKECVRAINANVLIHREGSQDKEFHFQNWCRDRLVAAGVSFSSSGRNAYPDFSLDNIREGYEIKGLAFPGRDRDFDANSNIPTGEHDGRRIFYIFGRYPRDTSSADYPVLDLILCHGDFLNADHDYVHQNKHIDGFGTYGDIMIRDRKMYVPPTPFRLLNGSTGNVTLIVPSYYDIPEGFFSVGEIVRIENEGLVAGYDFDLQNNILTPTMIPNPSAGLIHRFTALRCEGQSSSPISFDEGR